MPNAFIDARGLVNEPDNDLLSLLTLVNLAKDNKATLTPQENRIDSLFKQPMSVDAKANFIKTLGQDLRNQQPYREQEVIEDTRVGNRDVPTTVTKPVPPKPHTDTSSMDSLFALLSLLNLPALAKTKTLKGLAGWFGPSIAQPFLEPIIKNAPKNSAQGFERLTKTPPSPF